MKIRQTPSPSIRRPTRVRRAINCWPIICFHMVWVRGLERTIHVQFSTILVQFSIPPISHPLTPKPAQLDQLNVKPTRVTSIAFDWTPPSISWLPKMASAAFDRRNGQFVAFWAQLLECPRASQFQREIMFWDGLHSGK